jgi:hypothetical protein
MNNQSSAQQEATLQNRQQPDTSMPGKRPLHQDVAANSPCSNKPIPHPVNRRVSEPVISSLMALSDGLIILICGLCLYLLHPGLGAEHYPTYMATIAINIFFTLWVFQLAGLYKINQRGQKRVLIHKLVIVFFFVSLAIIALIFALKNSEGHSRIWFFSWFFSSACLLVMERLFFYRLVDKWGVAGKKQAD